MRGTVIAVCVSDVRGVGKHCVDSVRLVPGWGIVGDAHGGDWHRQVSLLSYGSIREFNEKGAGVAHGDFGENIVVDGIDFSALPVGTRLVCGDAAVELTQIGKECHTHCKIYQKMGDCIMPRKGVFARVIAGGVIKAGDTMEAVAPGKRKYTAAVLTLSDRCDRGEREDKSGEAAAGMLAQAGYAVEARAVLPDEQALIEAGLIDLCDRRQMDLVITTGGTGFSRRDVTPEATLAVAEKNAPGIAEAIRLNSLNITGKAMLSRGVSAIRGASLIVNLPGSEKAVRESLGFVLPHIRHGIEILRGDVADCGGANNN